MFLLTNMNINVVLIMFFFNLSNTEINFTDYVHNNKLFTIIELW